MDIQLLKTFVAVARAGTITRASATLHLSQPAVSAHIKTLEETLGLALFERTARGMTLSPDGGRLLTKAERALAMHQEVIDEAMRIKGQLTGSFRLGAGSNSNNEAIGRLLTTFAARLPDVDVVLKHGTSAEIVSWIRDGSVDAGFYNEPGEPPPELAAIEVARFKIFVAAAPGVVAVSDPLDWALLEQLPWIYPTASACCGRAAEKLFKLHRIQPQRVISVDREDVTRTLVASGIGVGLLHANAASKARDRGEIVLLEESPDLVRILFAHRANRAGDPLLSAAITVLQSDHR